MNKENLFTGILIFIGYTQMSMKFFAGIGVGIFLGTKHDFKPYVKLFENKLEELHKEIEEKHNQLKAEEERKRDPPADASFFGSWFKSGKSN